MCYSVNAILNAQLKRAIRLKDQEWIDELLKKLNVKAEYHLASAFDHPELFIYTNEDPSLPQLASWGLIPHWVKDEAGMQKIWNRTLNARGETIFEKPAFRDSAKTHRCLIYVAGFYEHHHFKGKTYPYYIQHKNQSPLIMAGLWSEWLNTQSGEIIKSFSIVTTQGNPMMAEIHNNPKIEGPRMPLLLAEEMAEQWIEGYDKELVKDALNPLIQSYPEELLSAHTVAKLKGKNSPGNVKEITNEVVYPELKADSDTLTLF